MWSFRPQKVSLVDPENALKGRSTPIESTWTHQVLQSSFTQHDCSLPPPPSCERLIVGMGCFWGAERLFWKQEGVLFTSVGYAGGYTPNPTYQEVCSGLTGHSEVVQIDYETDKVSLKTLLKLFWETHDPTQGMRQGNDIGTQYRSVIYYTTPGQRVEIMKSVETYQKLLDEGQVPQAMGTKISTEIKELEQYYYAEEYHQQYLHKNPNGYCGLKGTGVTCVW